MNDADYSLESAVYPKVWWWEVRLDEHIGVIYVQEGTACVAVGKCMPFRSKETEYVLHANYIHKGRMHVLGRYHRRPYTRLGATRIVKRWMREISQK